MRQNMALQRFSRNALSGGLGGGLGIGLIFVLISWGSGSLYLTEGLLLGLANWLRGGLIFGLSSGLLSGLIEGDITTRTVTNEGIRRSLRSAIVAGLVGGVLGGLVFRLLGGDTTREVISLDGWMQIGGLVGGLIFGLLYGGSTVLQHYTLRWLLYRNGSLPLRLVPFLDYCTERIFLRKVGGGYIFVHRLLMEHFASLYAEQTEEKRQV
jgi:hypothetical protein